MNDSIKLYPEEIFIANRKLFFSKYKNYLNLNRIELKTKSISDLAKIHKSMLEYHILSSENYVNSIYKKVKKDNPDIIIRDTCALFGRKIADLLNIPCIGYATSLIIPERVFGDNLRFAVEYSFGYDMENKSECEVEKLISLFKKNSKQLSKKYNYRLLPINHQVDPDEKLNFCYGLPLDKIHANDKYIFVKPPRFENRMNYKEKKKNIYMSSGTVVVFPIHVYKKVVSAISSMNVNCTISFKLLDTGLVKLSKIT